MGVNYLGFNPFLEGPISLFQVSNGSCSDFSVIIVLKLLSLSDITLTQQNPRGHTQVPQTFPKNTYILASVKSLNTTCFVQINMLFYKNVY